MANALVPRSSFLVPRSSFLVPLLLLTATVPPRLGSDPPSQRGGTCTEPNTAEPGDPDWWGPSWVLSGDGTVSPEVFITPAVLRSEASVEYWVTFRLVGDGTEASWSEGPFLPKGADPLAVAVNLPQEAVGEPVVAVTALALLVDATTGVQIQGVQAEQVVVWSPGAEGERWSDGGHAAIVESGSGDEVDLAAIAFDGDAKNPSQDITDEVTQ